MVKSNQQSSPSTTPKRQCSGEHLGSSSQGVCGKHFATSYGFAIKVRKRHERTPHGSPELSRRANQSAGMERWRQDGRRKETTGEAGSSLSVFKDDNEPVLERAAPIGWVDSGSAV